LASREESQSMPSRKVEAVRALSPVLWLVAAGLGTILVVEALTKPLLPGSMPGNPPRRVFSPRLAEVSPVEHVKPWPTDGSRLSTPYV
jgi:hypothetical protein